MSKTDLTKNAPTRAMKQATVGATALKSTKVKIMPAKGRPMLTWVGKRPLSYVTAFPAQHVETFESPQSAITNPKSDIWRNWPAAYPKGGLLFHGDNKEVLAHLLANSFRGKVNLIYIDPPYDEQVCKVALADVPEKKTDFVAGKYELPAPSGETTVAVKLIDMLGEEVLVVNSV